jgi:NAD(P)-dependent dehydrogenase (short-subunit alcohol dehydrogenase family)/alkylhydroperoxidase family enzyme
MPAIEPVPLEHLDDELQGLIRRSRATGMLSTSVPHQVWAYRPELTKSMLRRHVLSHENSVLDARLQELVRLRIAVFNDCRACRAARKSDTVGDDDVACLSSDADRFTPRERLALRFAELFATDHSAIDDGLMADLGACFSKPEIIELGLFCASALGNGRLAHVLRAYPDDERPPVLRYEGEFAPADVAAGSEFARDCLSGRVAIVTGAASGIGREHALLFAAQGASVVVNDLRGAQSVVDDIVAAGGRALAFEGDVGDLAVARAMIAATVQAFGGLDVLVNNAGLLHVAPFAELNEDDWMRGIHVNLHGTWAPARAAVDWWRREARAGRLPRASIVNTTSGTGLLGNVGRAPYSAGKAAVVGLTLSLAQELSALGVRVNAIAPAARTPMSQTTQAVAAMMRAPEDPVAFDPWDPRHVAPLVAYLATADCAVTGQVFHVASGKVGLYAGWTLTQTFDTHGHWSLPDLAARVPALIEAQQAATRGADQQQRDAWRAAAAAGVVARVNGNS